MVELAGEVSGPVLDPACGIGSSCGPCPVRGRCSDGATTSGWPAWRGARLAFGRDRSEISEGDSLRADAFPGVRGRGRALQPAVQPAALGRRGAPVRPAMGVRVAAEGRIGARLGPALPGAPASGWPSGARDATGRRVETGGAFHPRRAAPPGRAAGNRLAAGRGGGALAPRHAPVGPRAAGSRVPARGLLLVDASAGTPARIDELGWPVVVERVRAARRLLDGDERATENRPVSSR